MFDFKSVFWGTKPFFYRSNTIPRRPRMNYELAKCLWTKYQNEAATIHTMLHLKWYSYFCFLLSKELQLSIIQPLQPARMWGWEIFCTCRCSRHITDRKYIYTRPSKHATQHMWHTDSCHISSKRTEILVLFMGISQFPEQYIAHNRYLINIFK